MTVKVSVLDKEIKSTTLFAIGTTTLCSNRLFSEVNNLLKSLPLVWYSEFHCHLMPLSRAE